MNKKFFLIFFICLIYSCRGQEIKTANDNNMDTIYEKQYKNFSILFVKNSTKENVVWKTIYKSNSTPEVAIFSDKAEKNKSWNFQEERGESPADLYTVAGTFFDDKNKLLYIIYNRFGEVTIHQYALEKNIFVKENEHVLAKYLMSGGFGNVISKSDFIKIKEKIYFIFSVGQSGVKNPTQMYSFETGDLKSLNKIEFNSLKKIVKASYINDFGKSLYEQEKDNLTQNKEVLNLIKNNISKDLFFVEMPLDKEKYEVKSSELHDFGIEGFSLFINKSSSDNKDNIKTESVKKYSLYIKDILYGNEKSDKSNIQPLGYLYDSGQENMLYFFIEENKNLEIVRFNNYSSEWLFGKFSVLSAK